jgi:3-oxoacyl-[acyl-carrier-protein] synthase III
MKIASVTVSGDVIVVGDAALAKLLIKKGMAHKAAVVSARAAKKISTLVAGTATALDLGDGAVSAVVGVGAVTNTDWGSAAVAEWCRVVDNGGRLILVDRGGKDVRHKSSALALSVGLAEIEQRVNGNTIVTSGLCRAR